MENQELTYSGPVFELRPMVMVHYRDSVEDCMEYARKCFPGNSGMTEICMMLLFNTLARKYDLVPKQYELPVSATLQREDGTIEEIRYGQDSPHSGVYE